MIVWSCSVARHIRQELRCIHDMNVSFYTLGTVLEKPTLGQLFNKFSNLYRTRGLITKIKQPALKLHPDLHVRNRNATSHNCLKSTLMLSPRKSFFRHPGQNFDYIFYLPKVFYTPYQLHHSFSAK